MTTPFVLLDFASPSLLPFLCAQDSAYCSRNVTTVPALVPHCHHSPPSLEREGERRGSSIIVL